MIRSRTAAALAAATLACALGTSAPPAHAAGATPATAPAPTLAAAPASAPAPAPAKRDDRLPGGRVHESDLPLMFSAAPPPLPAGARVTGAVTPLDPAHATRLRRAIDLRLGGMPDRARDSLVALDRELPHHPQIVVELALAEMASGRDAAAVSRLRAERETRRDSLLGSRELAMALERTGHARDAASVALETWIVSPPEAPWAGALLIRLAPLDARGITDAMRRACASRPQRGDLARGLAYLLARQDRPVEAAEALVPLDRAMRRVSMRRLFADEALGTGVRADSLAAREALLGVAADTSFDDALRLDAVRREREVGAMLGSEREDGLRIAAALADVPAQQWGPDLLLDVAATLRDAGRGADASALLARGAVALRGNPRLALERALDAARASGPARAVPALDSLARTWAPARFALAEAQFWAGQLDSAHANYLRAAEQTDSPDALVAIDRAYLLEESPGSPVLTALGTIAWARWRGDRVRERALADSLWRSLAPSAPLYAHAALAAHDACAEAGDWSAALVPVGVIADSLPGDRLAPLARQRAGEAWLQLRDERRALAQFEECLARYPKAWNSAEVRRQVERLRKDRRL